jgi:hypothetical protein
MDFRGGLFRFQGFGWQGRISTRPKEIGFLSLTLFGVLFGAIEVAN